MKILLINFFHTLYSHLFFSMVGIDLNTVAIYVPEYNQFGDTLDLVEGLRVGALVGRGQVVECLP